MCGRCAWLTLHLLPEIQHPEALVALVIPCHRVVRKVGGLGGYRWGVQRKRALLEREAQAAPMEEQALATASASA
jgi:6-O-methylguanine DNA methyltransferase, DNA binding domain